MGRITFSAGSPRRQLPIALGTQPVCAFKMGVVDQARPLRLFLRIKAQDDPRRLLPARALACSIEQTHIAHTGVIRSPIPIISGRSFRFNPVTDSGVSDHPGFEL